jgi:hypothetical protein
MRRRIGSVALLAAIGAALGLPFPALAAWRHHLEQLPQDLKLDVEGRIVLESGPASVECQATIGVQLTASTTLGHARTGPGRQADEAIDCKSNGAYAFCRMQDLAPLSPSWALRTTSVQTKEIRIREDGRADVHQSYAHAEAILLKTRPVSVRPAGVFCPVETISLPPTAIGVFPEGGPDTVASVTLNGLLEAHVTEGGTTEPVPLSVSGKLQIVNPAQRDTFSI